MKPNVDLTENRDFRPSRESLSERFKRSIIGFKFPWDSTLKLQEIRFIGRELIVTGNKKRRQEHEFERHVDSTCERCGKQLYTKPWLREYGLCHECDDLLENDLSGKQDVFLSGLQHRRMNRMKREDSFDRAVD